MNSYRQSTCAERFWLGARFSDVYGWYCLGYCCAGFARCVRARCRVTICAVLGYRYGGWPGRQRLGDVARWGRYAFAYLWDILVLYMGKKCKWGSPVCKLPPAPPFPFLAAYGHARTPVPRPRPGRLTYTYLGRPDPQVDASHDASPLHVGAHLLHTALAARLARHLDRKVFLLGGIQAGDTRESVLRRVLVRLLRHNKHHLGRVVVNLPFGVGSAERRLARGSERALVRLRGNGDVSLPVSSRTPRREERRTSKNVWKRIADPKKSLPSRTYRLVSLPATSGAATTFVSSEAS